MDYYCDNGANGVTDNNGYINIPSGCGAVTLKIGGVVVGEFNTSKIHSTKVTPSDFWEINLNNILDSKLQNIVQFLQSVDNNQNPYDGIFIDDNVKKLLANANINLEDKSITESDLANLLKNAGIKLLDRNDTIARYEEILRKKFNLSVDNIPLAKPIVENIPSSFVETNTVNISVEGESKTKILLNGKDIGIIIPNTNKTDVNVSLPSETYPKFCVWDIIAKNFHSSAPNSNFITNIWFNSYLLDLIRGLIFQVLCNLSVTIKRATFNISID